MWRLKISAGRSFLAGLGVLLSVVLLVSCGKEPAPGPVSEPAAEPDFPSWTGETMGSQYTVKIAATNLPAARIEDLRKKVQAALDEINRQMSHYIPESELSRFNRAPAGQPFRVSPGFAFLVRRALQLNEMSGGAFDPTLGPVINLWGFGEQTEVRVTPSADKLAAAQARTGCRHLRITDRDELIKDLPDLNLNLSAIAKGYGVDEMSRVLRAEGITNFFCSISGEIYAAGEKMPGRPWKVGISAPLDNWLPGDPLVLALPLSSRAISTSGDYQKFFLNDQGHRLSHIFDPRTGRPVQHSLGSVSVVASSCFWADALSTTLFVLGPEAGMKFIEAHTNVAALLVVRQPDGTFKSVPSSRFPPFDPLDK